MVMNPRLLRPRSTVHPEAQDWANRVIANGGTFSGSTLSAVSQFCRGIDAAGIRAKFYRLNLFCGSGLAACMVPLYRGTSLSGTQYGGSTDTNNNFVSGDYADTGADGGLTRAAGNTSKSVAISLTANQMPQLQTVHFGCGISTGLATPVNGSFMAIYPFPTAQPYFCSWFAQSTAGSFILIANPSDNSQSAIVPDNGRLLAVRYAPNDARTFQNATQTAIFTTSVGTRSGHDTGWTTFGGVTNAIRMQYYTIGDSMTAAQITAFDNALSSYLSTLGRV